MTPIWRISKARSRSGLLVGYGYAYGSASPYGYGYTGLYSYYPSHGYYNAGCTCQ